MGGLRRTSGFVVGILAVTFLGSASARARSAREPDDQRFAAIRTVLWRGKEPERIRAIRKLSARVEPQVKAILFQVLTTDPSLHVRNAAMMVLAPRVVRKDLPALRTIMSLERDRGLGRLLKNLVARLEVESRSPAVVGRRADGAVKAGRSAEKKKKSDASVFFTLNVGMQVQPRPYPRANLSVQFGVRIDRFEIGLGLGEPMVPEAALALGVRASVYSLRRPGFRVRHGLGVDFFVPVAGLWGFMVKFHLCDLAIRLSRVVWFEISSFGMNTGLLGPGVDPGVGFMLAIGLRFGS